MFKRNDAIILELDKKRVHKESLQRRAASARELESDIQMYFGILNDILKDGVILSYDKTNDFIISEIEIPEIKASKYSDCAYYSQLTSGRTRIYDISCDGKKHYRVEITSEEYRAYSYDDRFNQRGVYKNVIINCLQRLVDKVINLKKLNKVA